MKDNKTEKKEIGFLDTPDLVQKDKNRNQIKNREKLIKNYQDVQEESYVGLDIGNIMEREVNEQCRILRMFRRVKFKRIRKEGEDYLVDGEYLFGVVKGTTPRGQTLDIEIEWVDPRMGYSREGVFVFENIYELFGMPVEGKLKELEEFEDHGFIKMEDQVEEPENEDNGENTKKEIVEEKNNQEENKNKEEKVENIQEKEVKQKSEDNNQNGSKQSRMDNGVVNSGKSSMRTKDYKIGEQVNFYFSDKNYLKDEYIQSHLDSDGFLDLDLLMNFPRIKSYSRNKTEVVLALKKFDQRFGATYSLDPTNSKIKKI
jgi:hypothetical protein